MRNREEIEPVTEEDFNSIRKAALGAIPRAPEYPTINRYELLADTIEKKPYGTIVHYQEIEPIIGEKYGTQRYYGAIAKAKKLLEDRGHAIKSIGKGDYQVLYPGDYTAYYAREVRVANNRIKHGGKILDHAPTKDMTISEMESYNRVNDFHARLSASISGSMVEVRKLSEKRHPMLQAAQA